MASAIGNMYRVKPIFDPNIEISSNINMYKVTSIESGLNGIMSGGAGGEVEERLQQLQQRQQHVLTELQQLQHSVQALAQRRGLDLTLSTATPSTAGTVTTTSLHRSSPAQVGGALQDLVISADPSRPPLSLLVLLRQLSCQGSVLTSTFVHSSAVDTPPHLRSFLNNNAPVAARSTYQLAVTLVWKKVPHGPRLMVSPTQQTCIQGEANMARYLSRLMGGSLSYEAGDARSATQVDEMLDLAQQQLLWGANKERSAALRTLNAALGKSSWLVGQHMSIADIVTWSALHQTNAAADAPANVKKWLQLCAQSSEFEEAQRFLSR